MEFAVELLLGAEIEFLEIYSDRGDTFYIAFEDRIAQIGRFPKSGPIYSEPFRRLLIPKSPFGIFYTIEGNRIFVQAIIDLRSDPERIMRRLNK